MAALGIVAMAPNASAHGDRHDRGHRKVRVLADGLSSPKGVATPRNGGVVVS